MDDMVSIRDIAPLIEKYPGINWQLWLAAIVVLGVLTLITVFLLKRRTARSADVPETPAPVVLTPRERALRAIDELLAAKLENDSRLFFTRLNLILRRYTSDIGILPAPARTSCELLNSEELGSRLTPETQPLLNTFLSDCDVFKFANVSAQPAAAVAAAESCRRLINALDSAREAHS